MITMEFEEEVKNLQNIVTDVSNIGTNSSLVKMVCDDYYVDHRYIECKRFDNNEHAIKKVGELKESVMGILNNMDINDSMYSVHVVHNMWICEVRIAVRLSHMWASVFFIRTSSNVFNLSLGGICVGTRRPYNCYRGDSIGVIYAGGSCRALIMDDDTRKDYLASVNCSHELYVSNIFMIWTKILLKELEGDKLYRFVNSNTDVRGGN